jgi:hypothetical protein
MPLIHCRVTVATRSGTHIYDALFPTTCDAAMDALDRIADARTINVKAIK